jgi:hypothetical protein
MVILKDVYLRGNCKTKRQEVFIPQDKPVPFEFVDRMSCSISAGAREISGQERPRDLNAIPRHEISLDRSTIRASGRTLCGSVCLYPLTTLRIPIIAEISPGQRR